MEKLDKRGLAWFLAFVFGVTLAVLLFATDRNASVRSHTIQFLVLALMFSPGLSAFIVRKFITREGFGNAGMKWGHGKYYLYVWGGMPLLFLLLYSLTWIFDAAPDFTLQGFFEKYGMTQEDLFAPQEVIIAAVFAASLLTGPILNFIPSFGEEYGWRGYLLPKLLPLGEWRALVLSGFIWGLWHVPFVLLLGFAFEENRLVGAALFTIVLTLLGILFGFLWLASGSTLLASFAHGVFNAQAYGIWLILFPNADPLIGGRTGVIAILVLALPVAFIYGYLGKKRYRIYNSQ
ncbi:MAG: CPBP family intramembrane metalloprotease [Nitrospinota bacterium]|nr:CPBP family intramembrane metalloprotease [Nitrospinota bacterium]